MCDRFAEIQMGAVLFAADCGQICAVLFLAGGMQFFGASSLTFSFWLGLFAENMAWGYVQLAAAAPHDRRYCGACGQHCLQAVLRRWGYGNARAGAGDGGCLVAADLPEVCGQEWKARRTVRLMACSSAICEERENYAENPIYKRVKTC